MDKRPTKAPQGTDVDEVIIRPAQITDADAIATLWEQLVTYHHELDDNLPIAVEDGGRLYADRIIDRLDDTHTQTYVAESKDMVIGYILGVIVDLVPEMFVQETGGFLADIFVDKDHRRQGVGRKLVDELSDWFRTKGVAYLELYVAFENANGRAFWKSVGGRDIMSRIRVQL